MGPGQRDCDSGCEVRVGGYFGALNFATEPMDQGKADVVNGMAMEVGEVLDRLHFGIRLTAFTECGHTGPDAQLQPSHGHGVPARRLPKLALALPWEKDAPPTTTARASDEDAGGKYL